MRRERAEERERAEQEALESLVVTGPSPTAQRDAILAEVARQQEEQQQEEVVDVLAEHVVEADTTAPELPEQEPVTPAPEPATPAPEPATGQDESVDVGGEGTGTGTGVGEGEGPGEGTGTGGGTGAGEGTGEGDGDGIGLGTGLMAAAAGAAFEPKWTELFKYTTLTPYQKKTIAPYVDYIAQARQMQGRGMLS